LWRFKLGLLLLFAMLGEAPALALVLLVPVLAIVACRERRSGRPFYLTAARYRT
jgi:hypothetical protein